MSKKQVTISTDEWLSQLDDIFRARGCAQGITAQEIAAARGVVAATVRIWLRRAIDSGRWECKGYKTGFTIDGRSTKTPVYGPK